MIFVCKLHNAIVKAKSDREAAMKLNLRLREKKILSVAPADMYKLKEDVLIL